LVALDRFSCPDHSATSQIPTDLMLHFATVRRTSLAAIAGRWAEFS
jgi:hypothetical protein